MAVPARAVALSTVVLFLLATIPATATSKHGPDPLLEKQWGLARIGAPEAWKMSRGNGAVVAVIDTGIDRNHPDLRGRLTVEYADLLNDGSSLNDENGHGTHVAGLIAATAGNGEGIAGVAPKAKILPVKVCDEGGFCQDPDIAEGIRFATEAGADVINLSISMGLVTGKVGDDADAVRAAVTEAQQAGVVVIVAAGNLTLPLCQEPASYAVCVGAIGLDDLRSFYSNGDATLTGNYLVAPGGDGKTALGGDCKTQIISTWPSGVSAGSCSGGSGYAFNAGSSMAAPHVSGVAALLVGLGLEGEEVVDIILSSAEDLGPPGPDPIYGDGLVDAARAVTEAAHRP